MESKEYANESWKFLILQKEYEAIEVSFKKLANADDFAAEKEVRLLEKLAKALQLDPKRFKALMEKHLTFKEVTAEKVDRNVILNIQEDMTREQKKNICEKRTSVRLRVMA